MADVTASGGRDRGQLFIVVALALATMLITLGVLLNTAIYVDVLAARDAGPGTGDVVQFETSVQRMGAETMHVVNRQNNTTYSSLRNTYDDVVNDWSLGTSRHGASLAVDRHAEVIGTTFGTRFEQDAVRNFSNRTGATGWTLAENVTVRDYSMTVQRSSLATSSPKFSLKITDVDEETWTVSIYRNTTTDEVVVVQIDGPSGTSTCTEKASTVTIDVTDATVGGEKCSALAFFAEADEPYDIVYNNTADDKIKGTYSLVVNRSVDHLDLEDFHRGTEAGNPYYTPALYSSTIRVTYRSPSAFYRTVIRVAPGEPDA